MKLEDAVPAVKSWFYRQCGWSLLVLDSADSIDNADDSLYIDLECSFPTRHWLMLLSRHEAPERVR